jgi:hypothetical protein
MFGTPHDVLEVEMKGESEMSARKFPVAYRKQRQWHKGWRDKNHQWHKGYWN